MAEQNFYIDMELNTSLDNIIDVIEFCKQQNIRWNFSYHDNIPYMLVKSKRYEEIEYLIISSGKEYYEKFICQCINSRRSKVIDEFRDVLKFIISTQIKNSETPIDVLLYVMDHNINVVEVLLECFLDNRDENLLDNTTLDDYINSNNGIALITAVGINNLDMVKLLIKHGATINVCTKDPIIEALQNNSIEMVNYLINNGSKIKNIKNKLIEQLISENCTNSIKYIMRLMKKGKMKKIDWSKYLDLVIRYGKPNMLNLLLNTGIDISDKCNEYINISQAESNKEMIMYLTLLKNNCLERANKLWFDKIRK